MRILCLKEATEWSRSKKNKKILSVSSPNEEGIRIAFFKINGENRMVEVQDLSLNILKVENVKIDNTNPDENGNYCYCYT